MSTSPTGAKVAILALLEAKPGKENIVAEFLAAALPLAQAETRTLQWYAVRLGPSSFAIFDTFADDAGRKTHLEGRIAVALMQRADELLAKPPQIIPADLLAMK
jgi:quinol monooxygenase YgiN